MKALIATVFAVAMLGATAPAASALTIHVGGGHHRHCSNWGWHNHHHDRFCRHWGW
jgi:hypothetical protein